MSDDLLLLPDVERLLSAFLRAQDEIADLVDARVYTELPDKPIFPCVRLTRFSGTPVLSRALYLDVPQLQIDVWGGPKHTAWKIAETCRAVMAARLVGAHTGFHDDPEFRPIAVTGVEFGEFRWEPDETVKTENGKARPRYLFTCSITLHP